MNKLNIILGYLCIALGVTGIIMGILSGSILAVVASALLTLGGLGNLLDWDHRLVLVFLVTAVITNLSYLLFA